MSLIGAKVKPSKWERAILPSQVILVERKGSDDGWYNTAKSRELLDLGLWDLRLWVSLKRKGDGGQRRGPKDCSVMVVWEVGPLGDIPVACHWFKMMRRRRVSLSSSAWEVRGCGRQMMVRQVTPHPYKNQRKGRSGSVLGSIETGNRRWIRWTLIHVPGLFRPRPRPWGRLGELP